VEEIVAGDGRNLQKSVTPCDNDLARSDGRVATLSPVPDGKELAGRFEP
jgi:hypothetical protein